jgi:hypothetical protein
MLGKLRTVCLDKFIHSNSSPQRVGNASVVVLLSKMRCFLKICLTLCVGMHIFRKTSGSPPSPGNRHELSLLASRHTTPSGPDCGRRSPSSSSFGRRSPVPRQRLLRSQRLAPGQVRDAAQRAGWGTPCRRSGRCVWLLATGLLRRSNCVCSRGLAGPAASQAGSKTAAQIDRRSPRDTGRGGTAGRHDAQCRRPRLAPGRSLCNRSAPAHDCSPLDAVSAAAGKKTALTVAPVDALDVTRYATQYELLRSQFTSAASGGTNAGCSVMPPRGAGLALLLREGLPAWMRAIRQVLSTSAAVPPSNGALAPNESPPVAAGAPDITVPSASPSASVLPPAQRPDVTAILASLVLSTRRWVGSAPRQEYRSCR